MIELKFNKLLSLFTLIFYYQLIIAQCGFDKVHKKTILSSQNYKKAVQKSSRAINQFEKQSNENVYIIPIVVHVIHNGEAEGSGANISESEILAEVDKINEVFRGNHFQGAVDFKIEFRLAQQTPDCTPTNGINRINATSIDGYTEHGLSYDGSDGAEESALRALANWPNDRYFNVWLVHSINGAAAGYAYFISGNPNYDGTFIETNYFNGSGAVSIHEFGHFLHLYHTFEGDEDNGTCPADVTVGTDSDGCSDTEPHVRNLGTCASGTVNLCTGNMYHDNAAKNIMNYCNCSDRFTEDQKTRSRNIIENTDYGQSLINSDGDESAPDDVIKPIANTCSPETQSQGLNNQNSGVLRLEYKNMNIASKTANMDQGYVDFSQKCLEYAIVQRDSVDTLKIYTYTTNPYYAVYIDLDNDGAFTEEEHVANDQSNDSSIFIPVTYPEYTVLNTPLRMRVIVDLAAVNSPCYSPIDGQVEDYTVYVEGIEIPAVPVGFPLSFSPNNDGINDVFSLMGKERVKDFSLQLFDRYGNLMFVSEDVNLGWDGTFKGKALNTDVFKYTAVVTLKTGKQVQLDGNVALKR